MSADRPDVDPVLRIALALGVALLLGSVGQVVVGLPGGPAPLGFLGGATVGLVLASIRTGTPLPATAVGVAMVTAFLHVRAGSMVSSVFSGSQGTLALVVVVVAVLVLSDRVGTDLVAPMRGSPDPPPRRGLGTTAAAVVLAVVAIVLVATPFLLPRLSRATALGDGPRLDTRAGGAGPILSSPRLDMTNRPDLTDAVVFTVDAERATFWRGQTYDEWDGRTWRQTRARRFPLAGGTEVVHDGTDLGVTGDDTVVQRYRLEAGYSDVVFAAATAVSVEAGTDVYQAADGTMVTGPRPLGRGATYTVVSRRRSLDEATLRAADGVVPDDVATRYASAPVTTDRVRAAALAATGGLTSTYDKVRALEQWMGRTTAYSLDAPLSPEGVDVVDHFLFTARQGWCEQVASSLVVMARVNGIPARLVTGYVPGEAQPLTGTYVVRERDAHAWAEVWFPDLGWVPFDPTASVPLAGADRADPAAGQWLVDHAVQVLLLLSALGLAAWGVVVLVRRIRGRRAARPVGWVAVTDAGLVQLGTRSGWPRADFETATTYARSLARHLGDPRVAEVGAAVDAALYAPIPPDDEARARVTALLAELSAVEPATGDAEPEPALRST
jgi:transglutaminase-like putative cysteine protease